jgi:hypothetical protein
MGKVVIVSDDVWKATVNGLRTRSSNRTESTCVWAGNRTDKENIVTRVFFLDDYSGTKKAARAYRVPRDVTKDLFETMHAHKLKIIADLHTHPDEWVGLSIIDKEHPLEYRVGFISIIFPSYGKPCDVLTEIGFHEYEGSGNWRQWSSKEVLCRLNVRNKNV